MRAKQDVRPTSPAPGSEPAAVASHGSGPGWPIVVLLFVSLLGVYRLEVDGRVQGAYDAARAKGLLDEGRAIFIDQNQTRLALARNRNNNTRKINPPK